jgi:predicted RNA binding protein YcfA (HicA-like mRNA interferase family)
VSTNKLSNRHLDTLRRIAGAPTAANIRWSEVAGLLEALGCSVIGTRGSRFRISAPNGRKLIVHRPHAGKECGKKLIDRLRAFLEDCDD